MYSSIRDAFSAVRSGAPPSANVSLVGFPGGRSPNIST